MSSETNESNRKRPIRAAAARQQTQNTNNLSDTTTRNPSGSKKLSGSNAPITEDYEPNGSRRSARNWLFTLKNPIGPLNPNMKKINYLIYQKELGARGTRQFQGFVAFKTAQRIRQAKEMLGIEEGNFQVGLNRQACIDFCKKVDSRVEGPWEFRSAEGPCWTQRSELLLKVDKEKEENLHWMKQHILTSEITWVEFYELFSDIWKSHKKFIERCFTLRAMKYYKSTVIPTIFVSGTSGSGKTIFVKRLLAKYDYVSHFYTKGNIFGGYDRHNAIVFDELYSKTVCKRSFNQLMDGNLSNIPIKSGSNHNKCRLIIIISFDNEDDIDEGTGVYHQACMERLNHRFIFSNRGPSSKTLIKYTANCNVPPSIPIKWDYEIDSTGSTYEVEIEKFIDLINLVIVEQTKQVVHFDPISLDRFENVLYALPEFPANQHQND